MYCNKCHKQSPENFVTCAYCGAKLKSPKKKEPHKFTKKKEPKHKLDLKTIVRSLVVFASLLVVAAIIAATFLGSKPEKAVKQFVKSIETADEELYLSLYDDNIIKYKTDNHYFGEEETYSQMIIPLNDSYEFYKSKCGEDFELTYYINSDNTLTEEELAEFNKLLESGFGYIEFPSRVDILDVEIVAQGELGEYKSVYDQFWCMKIKGSWYIVDKTILADYSNLKTAS